MSNLTQVIINLCISEPKPITQIVKATQKNYNTVYASIQRATKKGLLHTKIIDGLLWIRTAPPKPQLDLLGESQKSNKGAKTDFQNEIPLCGPERLEAIHLTRSRINVKSIEDECYNLFDTYNERVKDAIICLLPNPEHDFLGPPLELPYKTRFNDEGRKVEELNHYEEAWEEATKRHRRAVMVTLTTDPKIQNSLWDGNRKQSTNLNRLLSHLTRKFGGRPTYINVNEFQGNGRIHLHIVIFGRSYIMSKRQLSTLWAKYGQGEIVDFKKLKKDRSGWIWDGEQPRDTNGKNPEDYLKKYLKKVAIPLLRKALLDVFLKERYLAESNLGWSLFQIGEEEEGFKRVRNSVAQNERYCVGYEYLGLMHKSRKEYKEALREFGELTERCPRYIAGWLNFGKVYLMTGDDGNGCTALERCRSISRMTDVGRECDRLYTTSCPPTPPPGAEKSGP